MDRRQIKNAGIGKLDEESVIYRAEDPVQKVRWRRLGFAYVVGSFLAAAIWIGLTVLLGEPAGILASIALVGAYLAVYVTWRRRRNKKLTGSPRAWPSS